MHFVFTATPLRDKQEQLKYVTSAKSETAEFANVTNVVKIPSLQDFLKNPDDIDGLTQSIQEQKVSIFGS